MIWNLLKKNISVAQIAGYAIANLVGLAIVLSGLRFYSDVRGTFDDEDSFVSSDYLIVSKPIPALSILSGVDKSATAFSEAEIAELKSQPWVKKVGVFESANFDVAAYIEMGGRYMSTALFFEAIPDEFYDISARDWTFDPSDPRVPIIISKDYLALYNFGFAASRGLPQLSEDMIGKVPLTIALGGNGHYDRLEGRIVGFSSRLNTIAVPGSFMAWANQRYGDPARQELPSRLIVEVNSPGNPAIEEYLDSHGIEVAGDKGQASRAVYLMNVITAVVVAVGVVISLLSVFILMLSIYLLMQKSRGKLRELMLLGYTPGSICRYYYKVVGYVNLGILLLVLGLSQLAAMLWRPALEAADMRPGSAWPAVITGVAAMLLVTAINFATIHRLIRKYF